MRWRKYKDVSCGGGNDQTRKHHLISWEVCCLLKMDGGLGIRSPQQMNGAPFL